MPIRTIYEILKHCPDKDKLLLMKIDDKYATIVDILVHESSDSILLIGEAVEQGK